MRNLNKTSLTRKIALTLGAVVVSTMTVAGAAQAKPKFHIQLHFGGGYLGPVYGWTGPSCHYYKHKWFKTGKFFWKKKYYKCMGWW